MGQLWNSRSGSVLAVVAATLLGGCEATLKESTNLKIEDFISSVSNGSNTIQASLVEGEAPVPGAGPNAVVNGVGVMINGGSSQQGVTADGSFTRVIVSINGISNYWELNLPSAVASQDILLGGAANASAGRLQVRYAVGSSTSIGSYDNQQIRFLRVGSGDIQISVAWSDSSDVDLHVFDPNNEEIYYGHKDAASGGKLDLDGNAACNRNTLSDGTRAFVSNENVVWPTGRAIAGQYRVVLDYWGACGNPSTDYVVTVQRAGSAPQIFTGTFAGASPPDANVTTFTYP